MASVKPICVFCLKDTKHLIKFNDESLKKCTAVLRVRKDNNLSLQKIILPNKVTECELYHAKCYKLFTALPPKYRKLEITSEELEVEASTSLSTERT